MDAGLCFWFVNWAGRLGTIFAKNTIPCGLRCFWLVATCAAFLTASSVEAQVASVTLAWDAGTGSDIAGYRLYYGMSSGVSSRCYFGQRYPQGASNQLDQNSQKRGKGDHDPSIRNRLQSVTAAACRHEELLWRARVFQDGCL